MSGINERISEAFKATGLKKIKIAEILNVTSASISQYCSGTTVPSNSTFALIERTLGISEKWLKTGEGDMYVAKTREQQIADLAEKLYGADTNSIEYRCMMYLKDMPKEDWMAFERFLNGVVKDIDI